MIDLKKAYEAIDLLESLGLPVSPEQYYAVRKSEREYLCEEVIPLIQNELGPFVEDLRNRFQLNVTYSKENGLSISLADSQPMQERVVGSIEPSRRQKKFNIRVIFPDNRLSYHEHVWETLFDVVEYAGADRVRSLNIKIMGDNLVSDKLNPNERYRAGQKEVAPGLYVCTYSSTDVKFEQIKTINRELKLGLKLEKVLLV